jgi:hypothetical protein
MTIKGALVTKGDLRRGIDSYPRAGLEEEEAVVAAAAAVARSFDFSSGCSKNWKKLVKLSFLARIC